MYFSKEQDIPSFMGGHFLCLRPVYFLKTYKDVFNFLIPVFDVACMTEGLKIIVKYF